MFWPCSETKYRAARMDGKERFVGSYRLTVYDTILNVSLKDVMYHYSSSFNKPTKDCINEEWGSWNYDEVGKTLTIYSFRNMNEKYGLYYIQTRGMNFQ